MDEKNTTDVQGRAKGGYARAESLTSEQRKDIARNAALKRWSGSVPVATHEGKFSIGDSSIACAVLRDGRRIITQAAFLRAMGRARSPKAGTGVLSTVDDLPFFLQADVLKPFLSEELIESTKPIFYVTGEGSNGVGYDAQLLTKTCDVYLKFRDSTLAATGQIDKRYAHIIRACDLVMRGLAGVAIIALVDEATGFQYDRPRDALQAYLELILRKELAAWSKRFPDEFYENIYKLKGWPWPGMSKNRFSVVAHYTRDLIYMRLAPGVLEELERRTPKDGKGNRKNKLHQWLNDDIGHPMMAQHMHSVLMFQRLALANNQNWEDFLTMVDKVMPRKGDNLQFNFSESFETNGYQQLSAQSQISSQV